MTPKIEEEVNEAIEFFPGRSSKRRRARAGLSDPRQPAAGNGRPG